MKRLVFLPIVCTCISLLSACAPAPVRPHVPPSATAVPSASVQPPAGYRQIAPDEAKRRMGDESGIILLDVRSQEEYDQGHIPGAVLLPVDDIAARAEETLPDKGAVIFVYCRSGRRSAIAAGQLAGMGYTQVHDLGGIVDWPYEVVK